MKKIYNIPKIAFSLSFLFLSLVTYAQCPNNNIQYGTSSAPNAVGQIQTLTTCIYGGEYRLVTGLQSGSQYAFETCGDTDFDTQISVYDAVTGSFITYNDDFCGLQSRVTFTSNGNNVRVLVDRYNCGSQSSCMTLKATRLSGPAAANPCNSLSSLTCNSSGSFSLSGTGAWNNLGGPYSTPGNEKVFSFTAVNSGVHQITINSNFSWVDLYYKASSCGPSGWTYVDDIYSSAINNLNLTAGVTYYFLIDDENTWTSSGSISINCPSPASNPCNSISNLTCGVNTSFTLPSGNGAWNPPGPWGTPGKEKVFSYTPTISQSYQITVTNNNYYVDLFYKSLNCSSTGWSYVDDIYSSGTNSLFLTAGVTYYFLIDDENTSASSGTIRIDCPCIPPIGGIDASITVNSNTSYSSNTIGACNDCSFRSSDDRVLEVNIPCAGTYTFSTCGGANWDTYLYLTTAPCGGSVIAFNDDNCGLQSSITASLSTGTYYVSIEGFSSFSKGAFTLDISKTCNLTATASSPQFACGYNVSCNGLNDGSASVLTNGCGALTYSWSNGGNSSNISGLTAGAYTITVTDQFGCSANSSVNLTEPDALVVDAGNDEIVYYGYTPMSCASLNGSVVGGCASYTYNWVENNTTVSSTNTYTACPSSTTTYTFSVTDQNGCVASDEVTVCAVDVVCYAGNSNNQKVEMCHIPPGNNNNPQTICISASAVPAHLAHGCSLGACGEIAASCGGSSARIASKNHQNLHSETELIDIEVMPNPFENEFNVSLTLDISGDYRFEIIDLYGRVIQTSDIIRIEAFENQLLNFSTSDFAKGLYLIRVLNTESGIIGQSKMIMKNN
jgi:hypothetical protein